MKLIDADALLKQLGISERFNNADIPAYVIGIIKGMPEAVVRCEDCIRRDSDRCPFNRGYHANGVGINIFLDYTKNNGFCHWGVKA